MITLDWGSQESVDLYLDRCQVDTPSTVTQTVWQLVLKSRASIGKVVDFGAGDGRFAHGGKFREYVGYEVDRDRVLRAKLPDSARLLNLCAFDHDGCDADLCIGNPPYVRNQDLPSGWRRRATSIIQQRAGISLSGLANAWQYFTMLALLSTKSTGLVALVIPYEWVSRPSAKILRKYIKTNGWTVRTYRLRDSAFDRVLTTSSITIIDKADPSGTWSYYQETTDGFLESTYPTGGDSDILPYAETHNTYGVVVRRGLSPGTQHVLTLTESERKGHSLRINRDVVRCVTSLRDVNTRAARLSERVFLSRYVRPDAKCWLVRTNAPLSDALREYLDNVPQSSRDTATCNARPNWWEFTMPRVPAALLASGFRGATPKAVLNDVNAVPVGGIYGIYGLSTTKAQMLLRALRRCDLSKRVVAHSHGFRKLEVKQTQAVIDELLPHL